MVDVNNPYTYKPESHKPNDKVSIEFVVEK